MSSTSASEWVTGPDNISFYTKRWTASQPKARVVFVHGIIEHARLFKVERYNKFFQALCDRGISIFSFDQRGWGQTAQKTSTEGITTNEKQLRDLEFFLQREQESHHEGKLFLYGHSMGGEIVLSYACLADPARPTLSKLSGLIASAPIIQQTPTVRISGFLRTVGGMLGSVLPSLQVKIKIDGKDLTHDPAINESYIKDPLCPPLCTYKMLSDMFGAGEALLNKRYQTYPSKLPLLVYHGTEDNVTWFDASRAFEGKVVADDKTFMPFEGYFHELHNEAGEMKERVVASISEWILKRC